MLLFYGSKARWKEGQLQLSYFLNIDVYCAAQLAFFPYACWM